MIRDNLNALIQRGNELEDRGDVAAALQCYQQAIDAAPHSASAHLNAGNALLAMGRAADAASRYRRAADLDPASSAGFFNLGVACLHQRDFAAAACAYRRALELQPDRVEAWVGLGCALEEDHVEDAVDAYRTALERDPAHAGAAVNLSNCLRKLGNAADARQVLAAVLRRDPQSLLAIRGMADIDRETGRPEAAVAGYRAALAGQPDDLALHSSLLFAMNFLPEASAEEILAEHVRFGERLARGVRRLDLRVHRDAGRRLRVGYLSGDFRGHSVACFVAPLFEHHDRQQVEVHAFQTVPGGDAVTRTLVSLADRWHDISVADDDAAAERIRAAGIDVLVDLAGHTGGGRLPLLARKPAPVQFTWLGYLCTTGVAAIDYRLCDRHTDPEGVAEAWQVETPARMPDSQWCYRPLIEVPGQPMPLPRLQRGFWTFGSFNSGSKLNSRVLAAWSAILHAIPGSRLRVVCAADDQEAFVRRSFADQGIDASRLDLAGRTGIQEYFASFAGVDIALDTFPYSGGTTTCDALLMGVPVVTVAGSRAVSRSGVSLLRTAGLDEWIADDPQALPDLVQRLTADPARVQLLRRELPSRMRASPLMDGPRFAANLEALFRRAWQKYCGEHR